MRDFVILILLDSRDVSLLALLLRCDVRSQGHTWTHRACDRTIDSDSLREHYAPPHVLLSNLACQLLRHAAPARLKLSRDVHSTGRTCLCSRIQRDLRVSQKCIFNFQACQRCDWWCNVSSCELTSSLTARCCTKVCSDLASLSLCCCCMNLNVHAQAGGLI
jgi:hypothetical protein